MTWFWFPSSKMNEYLFRDAKFSLWNTCLGCFLWVHVWYPPLAIQVPPPPRKRHGSDDVCIWRSTFLSVQNYIKMETKNCLGSNAYTPSALFLHLYHIPGKVTFIAQFVNHLYDIYSHITNDILMCVCAGINNVCSRPITHG